MNTKLIYVLINTLDEKNKCNIRNIHISMLFSIFVIPENNIFSPSVSMMHNQFTSMFDTNS